MTQLTALIVDDEALARKRMGTLLGDCRQPVCSVAGEAGDAMQAMSVLRTTRCDVVLLDIHMPGADAQSWASFSSLPMPSMPFRHLIWTSWTTLPSPCGWSGWKKPLARRYIKRSCLRLLIKGYRVI
jgi:Response regulator receiver domain